MSASGLAMQGRAYCTTPAQHVMIPLLLQRAHATIITVHGRQGGAYLSGLAMVLFLGLKRAS